MALTTCSTCNLPFSSRFRNDDTCLPCFKRSRGYDLTKADEAHERLAEEAKDLMEQVSTFKARVAELETLKKRIVELESQVKSSTQTTTVSLTSVPETFLKTLIMLCHPDKHGNSEKASEATKILLALRKPR